MFPPSFRELAPPALELFDLDEAFSSVFSRLAQFTNKYIMSAASANHNDSELEFYVKECSKIVRMDGDYNNAKDILYDISIQCAQFKSIDTIK